MHIFQNQTGFIRNLTRESFMFLTGGKVKTGLGIDQAKDWNNYTKQEMYNIVYDLSIEQDRLIAQICLYAINYTIVSIYAQPVFMKEDEIIIKEYRNIFSKYAKGGIIDMDSRLKHKFTFQVHRLEDIFSAEEKLIPPSRQSHFFIVLITNGAGEKSIGRFRFPIQDNLLFFIRSNTVHSSRYASGDRTGYLLSFNLKYFLQNVFPVHHIINKKIFRAPVKPYLILSSSQRKKMEIIFEYILKEYHHELKCKSEMVAVKILELLIQCDRLVVNSLEQANENTYNITVKKFNDLVQQNLSSQHAVGFYAEKLNTHPNHLNSVIKNYTGLTAKETIIEHVLSEAKILLHSSSLSIKEIAHQLGFGDPNYFSSFFQKNLYLSPSQFRQNPV